jgi:single-strand DNA-binding protein
VFFNKVALIGFLGSDAEARRTKNGASYTVLSLATKRSWKNDQGNYESRSYWHRAVAWGKLAAFAATLKKGAHVQLIGELRTREYEKEYGNKKKFTVKQHVCEVALESILKLDRAERQEEPTPDIEPADDPA